LQLIKQLLVEDPTALVRREETLPVIWCVQGIPRDENRTGLLTFEQTQQEVDEANDRAAPTVATPANRFWQPVERAMREGIAIDNQ
jgi:hypothetical protein